MRILPGFGRPDLAFREWEGHGPAWLFLHGLARTGADWAAFSQAMGTPWRRMAPDMRGHGASGRGQSYRVADYCADIEAALPLLSAQPVVLMGHSLGALVGMTVAARHPDRVAGLILEDPPTPGYMAGLGNTGYAQMFEAYARLAESGLSIPEMARHLTLLPVRDPLGKVRPLGEMRDGASIRFMAACLARLDSAAPLAALGGAAWLEGLDIPSLLADIRCPVLLLRGDDRFGGMMPLEETNELYARVRDLTRLDMTGVGHQIHGMAQEPAVRAVTAFVHSLGIG